MARIVFLPHKEICPEGAIVEAEKGESVCDAALRSGWILNMPVKCHVHAQLVMCSFVKGLILCLRRTT